MTARWLPLESNPDTINTFLSKIGVSSTECVDVFSFDDDMLSFVPSPQLALLLCFPDYKKVDEIMAPIYEKMRAEGKDKIPDGVFFMRQHIANACGTFALFHALSNNEPNIDLGSGSFKEWLEKAKAVDAEGRSALLENDASLASAHEATARAGETDQNEKTEHHFIAYVVIDGTLYQIDSRAPFPRSLGPSTGETLVKDASKSIKEELIDKLDNISFSALALVKNNA